MTKRRPRCNHGIDQDLFALVCRMRVGHEGDHAWWSARSRVEWDSNGMVLASLGMRMWWPGRRYATRDTR